MSGLIIFDTQPDGSVTADGFPGEILVAGELLLMDDRGLMRYSGDTLDIRVANGRAVYQQVNGWTPNGTIRFRRRYAEPVEMIR